NPPFILWSWSSYAKGESRYGRNSWRRVGKRAPGEQEEALFARQCLQWLVPKLSHGFRIILLLILKTFSPRIKAGQRIVLQHGKRDKRRVQISHGSPYIHDTRRPGGQRD